MMTVHNCGCLPVIDDGGHLIGVITDRDVASAVASRHQNPLAACRARRHD